MPVVHSTTTGDRPRTPSAAPDPQSPVIEVTGLSFSYPDGRRALAGVSLTIRPGEKVALVGPNGAGKSTLMLHLNGILGDKESPVRVGGLPLTKENLPIIRGRVVATAAGARACVRFRRWRGVTGSAPARRRRRSGRR